MPSPIFNRVEHARYLDSVALLRLSRTLSALPGVEAAALMIGTPSNKALLREAGLLAAEGEEAGPDDLVIAVRASEHRAGQGAVASALQFLEKKDESSPRTGLNAKTLAGALRLLPEARRALNSSGAGRMPDGVCSRPSKTRRRSPPGCCTR